MHTRGDEPLRTAWYGRLLVAVGFVLTATTGVGLWGWPEAFGADFAWEIKAPLTASFMGAWYLGAAVALLLSLRERIWRRTRTILVIAFALTTTSLVATARFFEAFRFGEGSTAQQVVAWVWLLVYAALPPVVLVTIVLHERVDRRGGGSVGEPYGRWTRGVFVVVAGACAVLGLWLTLVPHALEDVWPWTINDLSASIVGAWALTIAVGSAWALYESDWERARIALRPIQVALALLLVAAARFEDSFTGSDAAIAAYVAVLAATLAAFSLVPLRQRQREQPAPAPPITE